MTVWKDQMIAAGVDGYNVWKRNVIAEQLNSVVSEILNEKQIQNQNFEKAMQHMAKMREFLSAPENILGSERTKHGEIAENFEVHIRNAREALTGQADVATFEHVKRTAAEDFILNNVKTQAKFINGTNNSLAHVLEHFKKYQDPTMDYLIPKDQYDIIQALRNGQNITNLSEKSINSILSKVEQIERQTGRSFENVVKQSVSSYEEVQLVNAYETLQNNQEQIIEAHHSQLSDLDKESLQKQESVQANSGANIKDGAKVAGVAVAMGAVVGACTKIYSKVKSGKKIADFTCDDWKEVGLESGKTGVKAGVTASSIYILTNLTSLSAPFAGAVTSAAMGMTSLLVDYKKGEIELEEVVTQGQILCLEAGIAAIGGALGQMLIPLPVIGAVIGTVTTNLVWGFVKGELGEKEAAFKAYIDQYMEDLEAKVDSAYHEIMIQIKSTYAKFDSLITAAFDVDVNKATLAAASIRLARAAGVDESKIIKDDADLDSFFLD